MPIEVGQDSSKTRKTLSAGGASFAYYSIPAAEAAGLGTFSKLPASLKFRDLDRDHPVGAEVRTEISSGAEWAADDILESQTGLLYYDQLIF